MIRSMAGYTAILAVAYLLFLVIQLPAAQVVHWVDPDRRAPLELYHIDGSLWNGNAGTAVIAGEPVGPLAWRFRPHALLMGRIEMRLTIEHGEIGRIETIAGRALDGELYLRSANLHMRLNDLARLANQPDLGLTGMVDADIERAGIRDTTLTGIQGTAEIADAGIGPPINVSVGAYTVKIETSGEVIRATLADAGGPLEAEGVLLLNPDGSYRVNAGFTPRNPEDAKTVQIMNALRMVGSPAGRGRIVVNRQGQVDIRRILGL